jgi:hypothetical protein
LGIGEFASIEYIIGIVFFLFRYTFDIVFSKIENEKWFEDISNKPADELLDEFLKGKTKESASYIFINNSEISRMQYKETSQNESKYRCGDYLASGAVIAHYVIRELERAPETTSRSSYLSKRMNARILIVLTKFLTIMSIREILELANISTEYLQKDCEWILENTMQSVIEDCLAFQSRKMNKGTAKTKHILPRIEFILSLMLSLHMCETTFEDIEEKCVSDSPLDPSQPILYIPALFIAIVHVAGTKHNYAPLRSAKIVRITAQDESKG